MEGNWQLDFEETRRRYDAERARARKRDARNLCILHTVAWFVLGALAAGSIIAASIGNRALEGLLR